MMRRLWLIGGPLLLAVAVAAGWAGRSLPAAALTNCSTTTQALDAQEQELLRLINEFRAANGVPALKPSPNLSRAAAWMAEDMAAKGYFDHTDSLGRSPFQRVQDCGYVSSGAGENLAIASSAQAAFNLFVNSPYGHRENMLRSMWVVAGIGRAGSYWAVTFGNVDDSGQSWDTQPPPQPTATRTATPTPPGGGTAPPGQGSPSPSPSPAPVSPTATPTSSGNSMPVSNPPLVRRALVPNIVSEQ
jgi:hypothetical protein